MAEINELLSPVAVKQMREMSKFLKDANAQYATLANTLKKVEAKTKTVGKSEQGLTALQKERARVANQTKTVFAKSLALQEKGTKNLIKGQERLKLAQKAARLEAQKQLGVVKKTGGLFRSMSKSIIATSLAFVGFRTVFNVFKNQIRTLATFEEAMSKVRAVAGALPKEFKALTDNALRLGSTTSKTATEVAGLQLEFSKLGFSTKEILAATEATISLSIAAGSDLAESAIVAASTIRGFGLSATETQRVVDVMAKSFSSSALDLEKFKTAMATVAPVARASGKDIEFTTAQLSILSDAGLDASTAGTSLRNMFLELNKQGLTWEQGLEKINTSTNKNVTALDLFGKRGATAALILADNTEKANDLEKSYNAAVGAAMDMAKIMEDNLIGDTNRLSSAWEGFVLNLNKGEGKITKFFRDTVQLVTKLIGAIDDLNKTQDETDRGKVQLEVNRAYEIFIEKLQGEIKAQKDLSDIRVFKNKIINDELAKEEALLKVYQDKEDITSDPTELFNLEKNIKITTGVIAKYKDLLAIIPEIDKVQEELTEEIKRETLELDKLIPKVSELNQAWQDAIDVFGADAISAINDKFIKAQEEAANKGLTITKGITAARKKEYDEDYDNYKETQELKKELESELGEQAISAIQETGNILFDRAQSDRERQLGAIRSDYAARIEAAEGNEEAQAMLADDLRKKDLEIRQQQAKSERNQALFNLAITTAQKGFEIKAQAAVLASNPVTLPLVPLALSQLGLLIGTSLVSGALIANQPIPAFFNGTTDTPFTYIAGDGPGSDTRELMIKQDGSVELTPNKATLYSGKEYQHAQIIPNKQTQEILANKAMGANNKAIEKKLDRLISATENNRTNIHFSRNVGKLNQVHHNRKYKIR